MVEKKRRVSPKKENATISDVEAILVRFAKFTPVWEEDDYDTQEMCALDALVLLPIARKLRDILVAKGAEVIGTAGGPAIRMLDGRVFVGYAQGTDGPELIEQDVLFPEKVHNVTVWGREQ